MIGYMDLSEYYKILFALVQFHKYSLNEVYEMYPFERDIFVMMLKEHIEEQKQKQEHG